MYMYVIILFLAISCMNSKCHILYHVTFVKFVSHISQIKYHNLNIIRDPKETVYVCLHVSNVFFFLKLPSKCFISEIEPQIPM